MQGPNGTLEQTLSPLVKIEQVCVVADWGRRWEPRIARAPSGRSNLLRRRPGLQADGKLKLFKLADDRVAMSQHGLNR